MTVDQAKLHVKPCIKNRKRTIVVRERRAGRKWIRYGKSDWQALLERKAFQCMQCLHLKSDMVHNHLRLVYLTGRVNIRVWGGVKEGSAYFVPNLLHVMTKPPSGELVHPVKIAT